VAAMRPLVVGDVFPVIHDRVRLDHRVERLDRGHLVADTGAERLHERFPPQKPGSMKLRPPPLKRHQSRKALAVISGRCPSGRAPGRRRARGRSGRAPGSRIPLSVGLAGTKRWSNVRVRLRVSGLIRNGPDTLSAEAGRRQHARKTPGSIATVAAERPPPASICASKPPVE
jgi:hypothetical protein